MSGPGRAVVSAKAPLTHNAPRPSFLSREPGFAVAILLLAFALRLVGISGIDLGLDGGLSVALARMPFDDSVALLAHDVHPPLFYILLRVWLWIVGTSPFAAKALGAFASTLLVAAMIGWTRSVVGARGALLAGLTLAVAPAAIEVGSGVREFGPAMTLMVLAAWAYTRGGRRSTVLFVIVTAAALWTSYAAVAVPVGVVIDAVARRSGRRIARGVVGGVTILPWLGYIFAHGFLSTLESNGPRQNAEPPVPLLSQVGGLVQVLTEGRYLTPTWIGPAVVGAVVLLLAVAQRFRSARACPALSSNSERGGGQARALRTAETGTFAGQGVFIVAALVGSLLLAFAVNTIWTREGMSARYALPSLPFSLVLLAALVQNASRLRGAYAGIAVAIPVIGLIGTVNWYARPVLPPDYWNPRGTVGFLDDHVGEGDQIVFVSAEQAGYYEALSQQPRPWSLISVGTDYLAGNIAARSAAVLPPMAARSRMLWLLVWRGTLGPDSAKVGDWLSLHEFAMKPLTTSDSVVEPYLTTAAVSSRPTAISSDFVDGVRLAVAWWPSVILPGDPLPVKLIWTAPGPLAVDYSVFIHLVDQNSKVWAQQDGWPVNGRAPTTRWQVGQILKDRYALTVPEDLPPGQYWLEVGLYDDVGRLALRSGGETTRIGPISAPG